MEEEVKYTGSCPQEFPLILLGNTQLGSEQVGRPELAEENLLTTELFSFAWVPPKITGEERGHLFRETGASQSVKNENRKKKKQTYTSKGESIYLISHISALSQDEYHPPKRLVSAIISE